MPFVSLIFFKYYFYVIKMPVEKQISFQNSTINGNVNTSYTSDSITNSSTSSSNSNNHNILINTLKSLDPADITKKLIQILGNKDNNATESSKIRPQKKTSDVLQTEPLQSHPILPTNVTDILQNKIDNLPTIQNLISTNIFPKQNDKQHIPLNWITKYKISEEYVKKYYGTSNLNQKQVIERVNSMHNLKKTFREQSNVLLDELFVIAANAVKFKNINYLFYTIEDIRKFMRFTTKYENLKNQLDYVLKDFWKENKSYLKHIEEMFMRKYDLFYIQSSNSISKNHSSGCLFEILQASWHEKKGVFDKLPKKGSISNYQYLE